MRLFSKKDLYEKWDRLSYRKWLVLFLPALYALCSIWIDSKIPGAPVTPLFAVIGVFLMSYFFRPLAMRIWVLVYCCGITLIFFDPFFWKLVSSQEYGMDRITPYVRSIGFLITSSVACFLNHVLHRLRLQNWEMDEILNLLPDLIITSDMNGVIHYVNKAAAGNLRLGSYQDRYASYFELLAPKEAQGATIAKYLKRIENPGKNVEEPLPLQINGKNVCARTQILKSKSPKLLMTVVSDGG